MSTPQVLAATDFSENAAVALAVAARTARALGARLQAPVFAGVETDVTRPLGEAAATAEHTYREERAGRV